MYTRRTMLKTGALLMGSMAMPAFMPRIGLAAPTAEFKTRDPKSALVLWFSQTGFTGRYGRLIACILKDKGFDVEAHDIRGVKRESLAQADLIIMGSPVYHYDIPINVRNWLDSMPEIKGTPVAAYCSYGGPEGNQNNSLSRMVDLLHNKGGVPVGMETFMNIGAFPTPSWDGPGQLMHAHLPNSQTYDKVRAFVPAVLDRISRGETVSAQYRSSLRETLRILPIVWMNKAIITKHAIDAGKCIKCRTCVRKCPVGAINPVSRTVDTGKCIACFGCINNCPARAVKIEYMGREVYGFNEFLKRNNITIMEPDEFKRCEI